jgi:hypothetical protein
LAALEKALLAPLNVDALLSAVSPTPVSEYLPFDADGHPQVGFVL